MMQTHGRNCCYKLLFVANNSVFDMHKEMFEFFVVFKFLTIKCNKIFEHFFVIFFSSGSLFRAYLFVNGMCCDLHH